MDGEPVVCVHRDTLFVHGNGQDIVISRVNAIEIAEFYRIRKPSLIRNPWFSLALFSTSALVTMVIRLIQLGFSPL